MPTISSDMLCSMMYCSVCEWSAGIDEVCEPRCPECGAKRNEMRIIVEGRANLEQIKKNLRKWERDEINHSNNLNPLQLK